ncbi:ATP-binding protein [Streptococcus mitis]|uniref:ATP-binding protein n=1 Tax=Streptococcus mitis TaxID=28037 RepID=UPI0021B7FFB1|nr:ATP-binding protein [Streptococcus mitis]
MNTAEIIEGIKKEYHEITWFEQDFKFSQEKDKLFVDYSFLAYSSENWHGNKKILLISQIETLKNKKLTSSADKLVKKLTDYIMITEITDKYVSFTDTDMLYDFTDIEKLDDFNGYVDEKCYYFSINKEFLTFHFVRISAIETSSFEIIENVVSFKKLDDFIQNIDIGFDQWNDYGYQQIMVIYIWGKTISFRINPLTNEIKEYLLGSRAKPKNEICSIGNITYYKFLKKYLTYDVRKEWFAMTNDLAFDLNELNDFAQYYADYEDLEAKSKRIRPVQGKAHNFFNSSFLRSTSIKEIKDVFHPLTLSGTDLNETDTEYSKFIIKRSIDDKIDKIEYEFNEDIVSKGKLIFHKRKKSYLPMNVYGIVGGNGSGKSYKLEEIIKRHVNNDNNFSQIIHFSLSPFDNEIEVNNIKLTDKYLDEEGNILYEKVGFVSVKNPLIETVIDKLASLELEEIKNSFVEKYRNNEGRQLLDDKNQLLKNKIHEINIGDSFRWYIQSLILDLIASEEKLELWEKALCYFSFEPWAQDIRAAFCDRTIELSDFEKISKLSSGQATILLYLTKLVFCANQGSLVIFDEPETFMHPPMIKSFIRAVSEIVNKVGAFCLVATHSPVVIQEIPHCNVYKLDSNHNISSIIYKTYGQNLDALYKNIYGVELQNTGYNSLLIERVKDPERKKNPLLFKTDIPYLGDEAYLKYLLLKYEVLEYELEEDD